MKNNKKTSADESMNGKELFMFGLGVILVVWSLILFGEADSFLMGLIKWIFPFCFGLAFIGISMGEKDERLAKKQVNNFNNYALTQVRRIMKFVGVLPTTRYYSWFLGNSMNQKIFFFDAPTPYFAILDDTKRFRLRLSDILEVNTYYDWVDTSKKKHDGIIKRAVVGGVLAGGIGAVIGGATAGSHIEHSGYVKDAWVDIKTQDLDYRRLTIHTGLDSLKTAEDIELIIRAIQNKYSASKDIRIENTQPAK